MSLAARLGLRTALGATLAIAVTLTISAYVHRTPAVHPSAGVRGGAPVTSSVPAPGPTSPDTPDRHPFTDWVEPAPRDLYGNPVTDAVAKYRLDATGSLYKLHSPDTELPRLRSPIS